jgi:hypothetical protein
MFFLELFWPQLFIQGPVVESLELHSFHQIPQLVQQLFYLPQISLIEIFDESWLDLLLVVKHPSNFDKHLFVIHFSSVRIGPYGFVEVDLFHSHGRVQYVPRKVNHHKQEAVESVVIFVCHQLVLL